MAILTELRQDEVRRACEAFGVEVAWFEGVLGGSVNTNYAVATPAGVRYFLRLYEEQDHAGATRETALSEELVRLGVPTPRPLVTLGTTRRVVTVRDKPAALFPFVEGVIRCQRSVTPADTFAVGAALARVHVAGARLDPGLGLTGPTRFGPAEIGRRLEGLSAHVLPPDVAAARDRLRRELDALASEAPSGAELPLVHGDLFRDNVLFHDAALTLLDFESASVGRASFDLAVTLLAWCFGDALEGALVRALGEGYRSVRPIDAAEAADLPRALRLASVRFATTRITDYELRPRGVGIYKDFRRWIARLDEVQTRRPELAAWLTGAGA